jgi:hypothetical protein
MAQLKRNGWLLAIVAIVAFSLGFWAGAAYRSAVTPAAYSATPKVIEAQTPQPPLLAAELTKLAEEVSGLREQLTKMDATLTRIEAALAKH